MFLDIPNHIAIVIVNLNYDLAFICTAENRYRTVTF